MSARTDGGRRPIQRLSPTTVERIAAGEVVERPASVVKELVENAIDAGALSVAVRLRDGGVDRIEVADDGVGIPPEELGLAVERHATSKLDPDGPVDAVEELGFRGEALASIGAVARLRLASRVSEREAAETLQVVGGSAAPGAPAPRSPGTTVEVADLFFNTPARRKFLKSAAAEQVEVLRTLERLYLARPTAGLRLEADGREVAAWPATPNLRDAAARVLGSAFLHASFPVLGEVPGGRVFGSLGLPVTAAPTSARLFFSVNGRSVASRPLAQAVRAAYGDTLPRARFPVGVLHLELERRGVDVNVHPTKREFRFARERELVEAVRRRVREALLAMPAASVVVADGGRRPDVGAADVGLGRPAALSEGAARAEQRTLVVGPAAARAAPVPPGPAAEPSFELLGALDALYWVAATDDGLTLIDQHAASERLIFEQLRRDGALARQQLMAPVTLVLTAEERAAWTAHAERVKSAGFEIDPFGPDEVRVRSVPTYRGRSARVEAVRELLAELADGSRPTLPDGLEERAAASIACHAAIRAGDDLAPEEMLRLIESLEALPDRVRSCPHGRPIFVRIPRARLDSWFLRRGG